MAHEMQSFEHMLCERNVSLNTVMVDGAPWFRGTDVAHALDYANARQTIYHHVQEEDRAELLDLGSLSGRLPKSPASPSPAQQPASPQPARIEVSGLMSAMLL